LIHIALLDGFISGRSPGLHPEIPSSECKISASRVNEEGDRHSWQNQVISHSKESFFENGGQQHLFMGRMDG
jgi:hypothetical protein